MSELQLVYFPWVLTASSQNTACYPTYRQNHTCTNFLDFGLDLKEISDVFLRLRDITFNSAPSRKIFEMFDRDDFH